MLFAVRFYDRPDRLDVREKWLKAHLEWLHTHSDVVLVGGSLRSAPEANPAGALWIVQCESKHVIENLFLSDPFWVHGLRDRYEIHSWHKAFPETVTV